MGQVIVKGLCSTDQWLIFIVVKKVITGTYEKKNYEKVLKVAAVCLFEVFNVTKK